MLTLGIDIVILSVVGCLHICLTFLWCKFTYVSQETGEGACFGSAFTVVVMLVSYIIMARVLDCVVGL